MTRIHVISGFLGAGKTTLIRYLLEDREGRGTLAILENEFGQVGLDGVLLEGGELPVREINSGCICCSLSGDFRRGLRKLIDEYAPAEIFVEPSGVGLLSDVRESCLTLIREDRKARPGFFRTSSGEQKNEEHGCELGALITVVDAKKYERYLKNFGAFFRDQIAAATDILVTRTEMLTEEQKENCRSDLRRLNPNGRLHFMALRDRTPAEWNRILLDGEPAPGEKTRDQQPSAAAEEPSVRSRIQGGALKRLRVSPTAASSPADAGEEEHAPPAHELFSSLAYQLRACTTAQAEALRVSLRAGSFGEVVRLKGIVPDAEDETDWIHIEYAGGEWQRGRIEPRSRSLLIFIGTRLLPEGVEAFFRAHEIDYTRLEAAGAAEAAERELPC